jgi:hypothetical protein
MDSSCTHVHTSSLQRVSLLKADRARLAGLHGMIVRVADTNSQVR